MAKVSRSQIVSVLAEKLGQKNLASEVAAYLLDENRTGDLDSLARDLVAYRAQGGTVEITAVSAHQLSPTVEADIKSQVKTLYPAAKEIIINYRQDASQIGGVRLEFPDKQLDLTVRNKLNLFKTLTVGEK